MIKPFLHTPAINIIKRSELVDIELPPSEVISIVEEAYRHLESGRSQNPTKIMLTSPSQEGDSVAYSMVGYDGALQQLTFKTDYRQGSESSEKNY